jgi:predicted nucleotidyltransferase component of viral defense system
MNEAVAKMLAKYNGESLEDHLRALREILQQIALLGMWRSKFFDKAAFYGGTALRILYGLDRYSEDLDFSLLSPSRTFDLSRYTVALQKELMGFGFDVKIEQRTQSVYTNIQSAFLKANTLKQLLVIEAAEEISKRVHRGQLLKIKVEVDTDPPPDFKTEMQYLLQPIPFAVRVYALPDLFAGKMHAILCRRWKMRAKGRDWYDLVWYAANHPELHLAHLEQRMRQTGHWTGNRSLKPAAFQELVLERIEALNIEQIRGEVEPFVRNPESLALWSKEFFNELASKIRPI